MIELQLRYKGKGHRGDTVAFFRLGKSYCMSS